MSGLFLNQGEKVSIESIEVLANRMEIILPLEYKQFVADINGGHPKNPFFELREFDPDETNVNCYIIIDHFFNFDELEEVWSYVKGDLHEVLLFPIADVRGGMILCCKQSDSKSCEIFFYDNNFGVLQLTDTLEEFLNHLLPRSELDYRKYGIDFTLTEED